MKTLNTILAASVLLIGASAANANYFEPHEKSTVITESASSRAQAYQRATQKLSQLQSVSPRQLSNQLNIRQRGLVKSSVRLNDGAYVTVQERMNVKGQLAYVGIVNLDVSYKVHDDDDD